MKTTRTYLLVRLSGITITCLAIAGLAAAVMAAEPPTGKGAASLLMKPAPTVTTSSQQAMSCATCKDEYSTRKDTTARGIQKPTQTVARHLCGSCDTTIQTAGNGKAKRETVVHTCAASSVKDLNCCAAR